MKLNHNFANFSYDYSTTMWEDKEKINSILNEELWTLKCLCGSSNCRNIVDQFFTLSKELQDYYIINGFVQNFILEKFNLNELSNSKEKLIFH